MKSKALLSILCAAVFAMTAGVSPASAVTSELRSNVSAGSDDNYIDEQPHSYAGTYYFLAPESWFKKDKGALNEYIGFYSWSNGEGSQSNAEPPGVKMTPAPEVGDNIFKIVIDEHGYECGEFNDYFDKDIDPLSVGISLSYVVNFDGYIEDECPYDSTLTCDSFDGWIYVLDLYTPTTISEYHGYTYCPGAWFTLDDYKNHKEYYGTYPEYKETSDESDPYVIYGNIDWDGAVTANDALVILRVSAGMEELTPEESKRADVDNDNEITSNDALAVLRYSVGIDDGENVGKTITS